MCSAKKQQSGDRMCSRRKSLLYLHISDSIYEDHMKSSRVSKVTSQLSTRLLPASEPLPPCLHRPKWSAAEPRGRWKFGSLLNWAIFSSSSNLKIFLYCFLLHRTGRSPPTSLGLCKNDSGDLGLKALHSRSRGGCHAPPPTRSLGV